MTPSTQAGRALLDDPLFRCDREAHETDGSARLRAILAIEAEARADALAQGEALAQALLGIMDVLDMKNEPTGEHIVQAWNIALRAYAARRAATTTPEEE